LCWALVVGACDWFAGCGREGHCFD
jgi:hypothetical protein